MSENLSGSMFQKAVPRVPVMTCHVVTVHIILPFRIMSLDAGAIVLLTTGNISIFYFLPLGCNLFLHFRLRLYLVFIITPKIRLLDL